MGSQLKISLTVEDINRVLNALGTFPYNEVVALINTITDQANKQLDEIRKETAETAGKHERSEEE